MLREIQISTNKETELIDITKEIIKIIKESDIKNGLCTVYIPHTTAGVTINENADPDVQRDMLYELNKVIPFKDGYHHMEGNSAAHIKSSMMGFSQTLIVHNSSLLLGTWQGVYFCEFDGPRHRRFFVKIIEG